MSTMPHCVDSPTLRVNNLAIKLQEHMDRCYGDSAVIVSAIKRLRTFDQLNAAAQVSMLDAVYEDLCAVWSSTAPAMVDLCKIRDELSWIANRIAANA